MRLMDLLRETLSALNANRGRSLLTVLGIIIGIGLIFGYWPARRPQSSILWSRSDINSSECIQI